MIGIKIADKITKVSKISLQNSLGTVRNETEIMELYREMPKERYISPEKKTDGLGLI